MNMKIVTLPEAAGMLGIKDNTLRVAAINGRIPAAKSGRAWLFDLDDPAVQAYQATFIPKEHTSKQKGVCKVCGKSVTRARAKYCSQECLHGKGR